MCYLEINSSVGLSTLIVVGMYGVGVGKGIGSGTIIDEDGTILTCAHAVVDFHGLRASSKGKVRHHLQFQLNA